MRVAVIGLGVIGRVHARILRDAGMLYAVCDVDASKLADYPDVAQVTDYTRLLDELQPDAVHICTPHSLHAEMVIAALERNVHVLCEKPLCISHKEIDAVLRAEERSSARLGVCLQNRYNPANRFAKEYLADKQVNAAVAHVAWNRDADYYAAADWRGKWESEGGGVLINQALHTLDLLQWLSGKPENLVASVSNLTLDGVVEVEDTAVILGEGKSRLSFFATNGAGEDLPVEITLKTNAGILKILPKAVLADGELHTFESNAPVNGKVCYGNSHGTLIADFYRCIDENRPFPINGQEGAEVVRLILAAYESRGKRIAVR